MEIGVNAGRPTKRAPGSRFYSRSLLAAAFLSSPPLFFRVATLEKGRENASPSYYYAVQFPIRKHPKVAVGSRVSLDGRDCPSLAGQGVPRRRGGRGAKATSGEEAAEWGGGADFLAVEVSATFPCLSSIETETRPFPFLK